jgi:putative nucleotidyltransferase with HDIG domain
MFNEITRMISSTLDLTTIMEKVGQLTAELIGADSAGIALVDPNTKDPYGIFYYNAPEGAPTSFTSRKTGLMWEVMESGKPIMIQNYSGHPMAMSFWVEAGVRGTIIVPLVAGDIIIGVLGLFLSDPDKQYNQRDVVLIESIGRQIGVAIHKALLFDETTRRSQELSALYDIALATGSILDTPTLLEQLHNKVKILLKPDSYGVALYDEDKEEFEIVMALDYDQVVEEAIGARFALEDGGLTGWIMTNKKTLLIRDLETETPPVIPKQYNNPVRTWLGIPLISRDRLVGAISVQSFEPNAFNEEDCRFLESIASQVAHSLENAHLFEELEDAFVQTVLTLANAMDARDSYTHDHSQRMAILVEETARELGCDETQLETFRWATLLHDIGKIGVPDEILLKPSALSDAEYKIVQRHPALGASIIAPVKKLVNVAPIIHYHQEKYDGTGYPDGLKGEGIPLGARILTVVDSYIAMTDDRVYRKARSHEEALKELKSLSGKQYDPKIVKAFLKIIKKERKKKASSS